MTAADGSTITVSTPEEAVLASIEHGAVPADPATWPWGADTDTEARPFCPDTATCFPNGVDPAWASVTCLHGSFEV